jgi:conjugal transfer pilus assembly protein TraE
MKFILFKKRLGHLSVQRNTLAGLTAILLLVVLLQVVLLFFKNERIIISPPELNQSYWIEGKRFSQSYLEEMALLFTHLLLDVTEESVIPQGEVILRYVRPEYYGTFKAKLLDDEKRLKKQQLSLNFRPKNFGFPKPLVIDIQGILTSYVASQKVSQVQETYRLRFSQKSGRLFLDSFEVIQSEGEHFDEKPIE